VTHDQGEAMIISDRIAMMCDGAIVQIGEPRDIYQRPRTRFAAEFVGAANLVPCVVIENRGERVTVQFTYGVTAALRRFPRRRPVPREDAFAVLRPEHLKLCIPSEGQFSGEIVETRFLGTHNRYGVRLDDGSVVSVLAPPGSTVDGGATGLEIQS